MWLDTSGGDTNASTTVAGPPPPHHHDDDGDTAQQRSVIAAAPRKFMVPAPVMPCRTKQSTWTTREQQPAAPPYDPSCCSTACGRPVCTICATTDRAFLLLYPLSSPLALAMAFLRKRCPATPLSLPSPPYCLSWPPITPVLDVLCYTAYSTQQQRQVSEAPFAQF